MTDTKMVNSRVQISLEGEDLSVPLDEGMPDINPEKICFVILKSRELAMEDTDIEADASNETDDGFSSILTHDGQAPTEAELLGFIDAMDEDEQNALVAMMWIGRGDYEAADWKIAVAEARARRSGPVSKYLLGTPLLSDYLETALAEFGESCEDFEKNRI
jgi:hypothetical protein